MLNAENLGLQAGDPQQTAREKANSLQFPDVTPSGIDLPAVIDAIEKKYLHAALTLSWGNESKAAQLLSLSRDKFRYRRLKFAMQ